MKKIFVFITTLLFFFGSASAQEIIREKTFNLTFDTIADKLESNLSKYYGKNIVIRTRISNGQKGGHASINWDVLYDENGEFPQRDKFKLFVREINKNSISVKLFYEFEYTSNGVYVKADRGIMASCYANMWSILEADKVSSVKEKQYRKEVNGKKMSSSADVKKEKKKKEKKKKEPKAKVVPIVENNVGEELPEIQTESKQKTELKSEQKSKQKMKIESVNTDEEPKKDITPVTNERIEAKEKATAEEEKELAAKIEAERQAAIAAELQREEELRRQEEELAKQKQKEEEELAAKIEAERQAAIAAELQREEELRRQEEELAKQKQKEEEELAAKKLQEEIAAMELLEQQKKQQEIEDLEKAKTRIYNLSYYKVYSTMLENVSKNVKSIKTADEEKGLIVTDWTYSGNALQSHKAKRRFRITLNIVEISETQTSVSIETEFETFLVEWKKQVYKDSFLKDYYNSLFNDLEEGLK